jgi:hypothetical protein
MAWLASKVRKHSIQHCGWEKISARVFAPLTLATTLMKGFSFCRPHKLSSGACKALRGPGLGSSLSIARYSQCPDIRIDFTGRSWVLGTCRIAYITFPFTAFRFESQRKVFKSLHEAASSLEDEPAITANDADNWIWGYWVFPPSFPKVRAKALAQTPSHFRINFPCG